jgi:hypothetical protein
MKLKQKIFEQLLKNEGIEFISEYKFHEKRKWRIDYFISGKIKLAIEIEGGIWISGRHTRPAGFIADIEKYNSMTELGIYLYRLTYQNLCNADTIFKIKKLVK